MLRTDPPDSGGEVGVLTGFVDFLRETIAVKTDGLDAAGLRSEHPPSTMTLAGMLKHLAFVEDYWVGQVMLDQAPTPPWDTAPWSDDPDWHSRLAEGDRSFSTNHLMGEGYWVWLIRLASGATSVGIVAPAYAARSGDTVRAIIAGRREGVRAIYADPARAAAICAAEYDLPPDIAGQAVRNMIGPRMWSEGAFDTAELDRMIDALKLIDQVPPPDWTGLIDRSFLPAELAR